MTNKPILTPAEARAELDKRGESQASWARRHGVSKSLVCSILSGRRRCLRGESHNIAVLLGLKDGQIFLPGVLTNVSVKGEDS